MQKHWETLTQVVSASAVVVSLVFVGLEVRQNTVAQRAQTRQALADAVRGQATTLNSPTDIVLTFADYLDYQNRDARRFDQLTEETIHFVEEMERTATAHVSLISTRFHARGIIDRRVPNL